MDSYFGKRLKRYAASQHPPVNGRARLLAAAASAPDQAGKAPNSTYHPHPRKGFQEDIRHSTWSFAFELSRLYSFQTNLFNMRAIL